MGSKTLLPTSNVASSEPQGRKYSIYVATIISLFMLYSIFGCAHSYLHPSSSTLSPSSPSTSTALLPLIPPHQSPSSHHPVPAVTAHPLPTSTLKNVAVIVDSSPLSAIAPLLLHFSAILGSTWQIIIYTSSPSAFPPSSALQNAVAADLISIREAPPEMGLTPAEIDDFLMRPWLWEQLAPAEHVLLFNNNSIICPVSRTQIANMLRYDLVEFRGDVSGAAFDGGMSLRNRDMMLDIAVNSNWGFENDHHKNAVKWVEYKMRERGARLPGMEVSVDLLQEGRTNCIVA